MLKANAQSAITLDKNYQKALYAWSKKNAKQAIHYLEKAKTSFLEKKDPYE